MSFFTEPGTAKLFIHSWQAGEGGERLEKGKGEKQEEEKGRKEEKKKENVQQSLQGHAFDDFFALECSFSTGCFSTGWELPTHEPFGHKCNTAEQQPYEAGAQMAASTDCASLQLLV